MGFSEVLIADPELHDDLDDSGSGVVVASPAVADFAGFAHVLLVEHFLFEGVGEVEVEDERSAGGEVGGDSLERLEQVLGVGDVVEAVEEAEGGIVLATHVDGSGVGDFEAEGHFASLGFEAGLADHGLAEVEAFDFEAFVGEHVGEGSGSAAGVEDGLGLLALHGEEQEVVAGPHAVGHGLHEVVVEFGDLGEAGDLGVGHAPLLYCRSGVRKLVSALKQHELRSAWRLFSNFGRDESLGIKARASSRTPNYFESSSSFSSARLTAFSVRRSIRQTPNHRSIDVRAARTFQRSIIVFQFVCDEQRAGSKFVDPGGEDPDEDHQFDGDQCVAAFEATFHDGLAGVERFDLGEAREDEGKEEERQERGEGIAGGVLGSFVGVGERASEDEVGDVDRADEEETDLAGVVLPPGAPLDFAEEDSAGEGEQDEEHAVLVGALAADVPGLVAGFQVFPAKPESGGDESGCHDGEREVPEEDSGEFGVHEPGSVADEVAVPDGERHSNE